MHTTRTTNITSPQSLPTGDSGNLMDALKGRLAMRRSAMRPGRKDDGEEQATGDKPSFDRAITMPEMLKRGEVPDAPISMDGMKKALQAAAANRSDDDDDDDDWESD